MFNNMRNGQGVFINKAGGYYNGTWLNDKKSGQGEQMYPSGDKYSGEWKDDKWNGRGFFYLNRGVSHKKRYLIFYIITILISHSRFFILLD